MSMSLPEKLVAIIAGGLIVACTVSLLMEDSYADDLVLDGGVGIFNSGKKSLSETKMLTLGIQEGVFGPLKDRAVIGGWFDNSGRGRSSSAVVAGQIGFEVNNGSLVAGLFTGPALISNPDVLLGGPLQFMDDLHIGIQDRSGYYIGIMYRHLSSAGLEMPNIGRDVVGLELRF
jgi:hypothetical protein